MDQFVLQLMTDVTPDSIWFSIIPVVYAASVGIFISFVTFVVSKLVLNDLGRASEAREKRRSREEKASWGDNY